MSQCKFLERYRVPTVTLDGKDYVQSERCRLGNEIPLGGCLANCPDFEPGPDTSKIIKESAGDEI
jgi:hypothetical protein